MPVDPSSKGLVFEDAAATDLVPFSVICRPASGLVVEAYLAQVALPAEQGADLWPDEKTYAQVAAQLATLGFRVLDVRSSMVFATGEAARFEHVFKTRLARVTRWRASGRPSTGIGLRPGAPEPDVSDVPGALLVCVSGPPSLANSAGVISPSGAFCVLLPDAVAGIVRASGVHKQTVPSTGAPADGRGVTVAVVDTGFHPHTYYAGKGYDIRPVCEPGASNATVDDGEHGTFVMANLLACAPGVTAYGVKYFSVDSGVAFAATLPDVRIISLSWGFDPTEFAAPSSVASLEHAIRDAVTKGITVVVAADNEATESIPGRRPDVITVGAVGVNRRLSRKVWPSTSCYKSSVNAARSAPDLCAIGSEILLPMPPSPSHGLAERMDCAAGETSCAAPQVAGAAALLLQKKPTLNWKQVRDLLKEGASDVKKGCNWNHHCAAKNGPSLVTGAGFLDAGKSWSLVT